MPRAALLLFLLLCLHLAHASTAQYFYDLEHLDNNPRAKLAAIAPRTLESVYEARNLEFAFPSEEERARVLKEGLYQPEAVVPVDMDVHYTSGDETPIIFVTIPRFVKGVPYSLAHLTNVQKPNGTQLQAYPSYDWHSTHGADCNGLTSVYRTQIDNCGRIWILDSGEIDFVQHCAPQLLAIDLANSKVVHHYRLPAGMYKQNVSRFVTPTVDVDAHSCNVQHVYMADSIGAGIVVYDAVKSQSWRIENKYTYPHPSFGTFDVAGERFELWDGTVTLALTPQHLLETPTQRRMLYFHSLSSDWQMAIPLDVVNNASIWKLNDVTAALSEFVLLGTRGSQCIGSAMSATGHLLCGLVQPSGIFSWHINSPYTQAHTSVLIEDATRLQFPSGVKIINNHEGMEEVWVLSNRLQKAFGAGLNYKEVNFRIQKCAVDKLLAGKSCTD